MKLKSVLIVEDDRATAAIFAKIFQSMGADVLVLENLKQAGDLLHNSGTYAFCFAMIDINLPDGSGQVLEKVLRAGRIPHMFCSASKQSPKSLVKTRQKKDLMGLSLWSQVQEAISDFSSEPQLV